jgi:uncharacterized protein
MTSEIQRTEVSIPSGSHILAGRIHRQGDWLVPQPGVVVSGSWLTVKEQMADRYASELAAQGFTALSFDFTGWGASGGSPRQTEMPRQKVADIVAATRFLDSLSGIRKGGVGYLAVCASAMYAAAALREGAAIRALASVAGWFHDTASVAAYYGGEAGVQARIERAAQAVERVRDGGQPSMVPAYDEGNDRAGMFIPLDYYASSKRGRVPSWRNEMSEVTWLHWLTFDGLFAAERSTLPTLFVHGEECALPENVRRIHDRMPGSKRLVWHPGFQVDYYDRPDLVELSVVEATAHFRDHLA